MISVLHPKVITDHRDGLIRAYARDPGVLGVLEPVAEFRPAAGDEVVDVGVRPDLERAVYATANSVTCLTRSGDPVWTSYLEPRSDERYGHRPGCSWSLDGRTVWVYRPDAMAGRGRWDHWVVHDADNGAVLASWELETVGHGGEHHVHPVDGSIYLDIGEGQDGSVILRGTVGPDGEPRFVTYPWDDRILIGLAPDGGQFMTVDHGQADVAFHHAPGGDVILSLSVDAFGFDPEETFMEWSGGYLTPDLAVVTVVGEGDDQEEWSRHYVVDVRTGRIDGEFAAEVANPYHLHLLGDSTWLTGDPGGHPVRRSRAR
ncbi:hypothetical protein [Streptomyces liangshanensis]|uniref:hypothetical protein n=1 Tax=Streptomyces liangshanensis TaxID=2717324 RepID=UPI0036DC5B01